MGRRPRGVPDRWTCPDCAAVVTDELLLAHNGGCPIAAEVDAMSDADRLWFERHPYAEKYFREARPGDWGLRTFASVVAVEGKVEVVQVKPGMRYRRLPGAVLVLSPEDGLSEDALFVLWALRNAADAPQWLLDRLAADR